VTPLSIRDGERFRDPGGSEPDRKLTYPVANLSAWLP
jgi:hypothetical protein